MIAEALLRAIQACVKEEISYAEFTIDGKEEQSNEISVEILKDGRISVLFFINTSAEKVTRITNVTLYNSAGETVAAEDTDISLGIGTSGIYYRFFFSIEEKQEG